jgi:hypothetical protein
VAPVRECSMLFAALIGGHLLGEGDRWARLLGAGFTLNARGPEALAQRIAREVPLWRDVIEKAGIPRE